MTHPQGAGSSGGGSAGSARRLFTLTGVSRASYYRHWAAHAPRAEESELRDLVQRLALANRVYGYRRITELVRRQGWPVNRKRVARLPTSPMCGWPRPSSIWR